MNRKTPAIATGFIGLGLAILSLPTLFSFAFSYFYLLLVLVVLFVASGLIILIKAATTGYQIVVRASIRCEFRLLGANTNYFILEFAKVLTTVLLGMRFPLEGLILFILLDIVDGGMLSHQKRALLIRHRIDKGMDCLCQIPMYLVALQYWPELTLIFTAFFLITVIKTGCFLWTGNRNFLLYFPAFFLICYLFRLLFFYFYASYEWIFTQFYGLISFTLIVVIVAVVYETIYNGTLSHLRYNTEQKEEVL